PSTHAPIAARLSAAPTLEPPSPRSVFAAPPRCPESSFLPAPRMRPGSLATLHALPASPLNRPAALHSDPRPMADARAGAIALAQTAQASVTAPTAISLDPLITWRSSRGAGRSSPGRGPIRRPGGSGMASELVTQQGVDVLYRQLAPRLERIVRLDVRAPDVVIEDACQVAWSRLVHHCRRVRRETALPWLATTAVREAVRQVT